MSLDPGLESARIAEPLPRVHDLRHSAVALAIASGAHPKEIQARVGHSSITVTLDRYGHLFPSLDERLAERLDAVAGAAAERIVARRWHEEAPGVASLRGSVS
jgi:integrase